MKKIIGCFLSAITMMGLLCGMKTIDLEETDLISKTYQIDETVSTIIVEEMDVSVVVQSIETDTISIECVELPEDALYDFSVSDNVLTIKKRKTISEAIGKNIITGEYFLTIRIPQKQYDNISIVNTSNGSVALERVDARTISIDVKNGDIIPNRTTSNDFFGKIANGTISFDHSNSVTYRCQVSNGYIKGTIAGNKEDYTIRATVTRGKNELNNQIVDNSCHLIEFGVKNGGIGVQFTD